MILISPRLAGIAAVVLLSLFSHGVSAKAVYWIDADHGSIERGSLDGNNIVTVISGLKNPVDVRIDPAGGKLYYT